MKSCARRACLTYGKQQEDRLFYKNKTRPDGLDDLCRSCRREISEMRRSGLYHNKNEVTTGASFVERLENEVKQARESFLKENIPHYANFNAVNAS